MRDFATYSKIFRIFNDMAEKNGVCVRAESFGIATSTGLPVSENSVIACKEIGIDLSGKASTAVADAGIKNCLCHGTATGVARAYKGNRSVILFHHTKSSRLPHRL